MKKKPCCANEALRQIRQIEVRGRKMGIAGVPIILEEVGAMDMEEKDTPKELLRRLKIYNYIPASIEDDVARIMMEIFLKEGRS